MVLKKWEIIEKQWFMQLTTQFFLSSQQGESVKGKTSLHTSHAYTPLQNNNYIMRVFYST